MATKKVGTIILAAGKGTRMGGRLPKVLQPIGSIPMLQHVVAKSIKLSSQVVVVVGAAKEQVQKTLQHLPIEFALQEVQLGTGDALKAGLRKLQSCEQILVLCADVPNLAEETLARLIRDTPSTSVGMLTFCTDTPFGYGRVIRNSNSNVNKIIEEKDLTLEQQEIKEVNAGVYLFPYDFVVNHLGALAKTNAAGEFYITDLITKAASQNISINTVTVTAEEAAGVNNLVQLAAAERHYQQQNALALLQQGVMVSDPKRLDVRGDLKVGANVCIDVNVIFEGNVTIEDDVYIGSNTVIKNSTIKKGTKILAFCHIDDAEIGAACDIGPYSRIRPGTQVHSGAKVGNFVEIKASTIGEKSKVSHLSYIGDTEIGNEVNVGAGTITCNYDGTHKHKTLIQDKVFVGSNTELVAPVVIGRGATIAAGTTVTKDVPGDRVLLNTKDQKLISKKRTPQEPEV